MKKFLASALAITLIGSSIASFAQDHPNYPIRVLNEREDRGAAGNM